MSSGIIAFLVSGPLPVAAVVIRVVVGAILLVAGTAKIRAGESSFFKVVLAYDLLPTFFARWLARLLPLAEIGVGGLLILGLLAIPAAFAGMLLLAAFTGATALALAQGKQIPCGCFGQSESVRPMRWTILLRNLVLIVGLLAVVAAARNLAVDDLIAGLGATPQWLAGLGVASALALSVRSVPVPKRQHAVSIS